MTHAERLLQWDEWIRQGAASKVRSLCRKLNHKQIPREHLVDYGHIARRVGAPDLIVLWLRPIVRSEKILSRTATDKEKALYALGLLRLGAFTEAAQILSEIDPEKDPQVYFYRASMNLNQWNYKKAVPDLKKYIHHSDVPIYSKYVGRLNLCAALVSTGNSRLAEQEVSRLMKRLDDQQGSLLKGNLLEIRSQLLYDQGQFTEALQDLEEASKLLHKADERSILYVRKWQLIIQLKAAPNSAEILQELDSLKVRAIAIKEWEIVRDCDLHRALALRDQNLIQRVFWGSHFQGYKERIAKMFGQFDIEKSFLWRSEPGKQSAESPIVDLVGLAPTPALKKLFFILTRELYQPLRTTEILDSLYPGEFYHPVASPAKLHRLITRAREWLNQQGLPIAVESFRNAYRLGFLGPCQLRLHSHLSLEKKLELPQVIEDGFFSSRDWAIEKSISERTARLQINRLVKQGLLEMKARGPQTRYRMK